MSQSWCSGKSAASLNARLVKCCLEAAVFWGSKGLLFGPIDDGVCPGCLGEAVFLGTDVHSSACSDANRQMEGARVSVLVPQVLSTGSSCPSQGS